MPDAVVIGGGVVGSYTAFCLANKGYKVRVLEKKSEIGGPVCCTGIISRECVQTFGIKEDLFLRKINSARIFSPTNKIIDLRRPETQAYVVDRGALDLAMATRARHSGVEYLTGTSARNIEIQDEAAILRTSSGRIIETAVVINASGFNSGINEMLGAGKPSDFIMGAQATVNIHNQTEIEVYFDKNTAPGFFGWLVPTSEEKALVGLLSRHGAKDHLAGLISKLALQNKIKPDSYEISIRGIPLKPLARTYGKRFIVVGGAAGQVKPLTGGGIYYGLLCAELAAEAVQQAAINKDFSSRSLSSYEKLWRKKLSSELSHSYRARQIFEQLGNRQLDLLFDFLNRTGLVKSFLEMPDVTFDWHGGITTKMIKRKAFTGIFRLTQPPLSGVKQRN